MAKRTYQLSVELQVRSTKNAEAVRAEWLAALDAWLDRAKEPALISAIECAEAHKFEFMLFSRSGDPEVDASVVEVATLIAGGADGGFGEFDAPAEVLIKSRWPNVTDWECGDVSYSEGVVTLHDLYVVE